MSMGASGRGVPNAGSVAGTSRSVVRAKRVPRQRRGSRGSFAAKVRSLAPYKHSTLNDSVNTSSMTHNTIYTTNITAQITQGDGNANRDGDAVILVSLKVKGAIHSPAATGAFMYRLIIGWSGEEYAVTGSSSGIVDAELILPNQGTSFKANANVNPKAFTVLHDEMLEINSLIASSTDVKSFAFNVPFSGAKFAYQASASTFGKLKNLYCIVIPSVVGGSGGVTACGSFFINTDLVFQNA